RSPKGAKVCTRAGVRQTADWARIKPLDPGRGALGRELEALRLILSGRSDDVPVLHTVFAPLTIARKLAGEQLDLDLRDHPDAVMGALDVITDTVIRYVAEVGKAGADGIFYASQTASRDEMADGRHSRFSMPSSWRALESPRGSPMWTMRPGHGRTVYFA